jgi:hypothetical protein
MAQWGAEVLTCIRRTGMVLTLNDRGSQGLGGYFGESMARRESHYGK